MGSNPACRSAVRNRTRIKKTTLPNSNTISAVMDADTTASSPLRAIALDQRIFAIHLRYNNSRVAGSPTYYQTRIRSDP